MQTGTQKGLAPVKFVVDASASQFSVQAFATGLLSSFGHNPRIAIGDYDGDIHFLPGTYEQAAVRVNVRTAAMEVLDEMKNDDRKKLEKLMYGEVLSVERFATAAFESQKIAVQKLNDDLLTAHVTGDLSFHGASQNLSFEARVTTMENMLRISGGFSLRQSDYGIKPVSFAGGALRLKDELKFSFELVARKQD
ncbi:MAG: YceI family protein [Candidatus Acidiferrum sp.]